MATQADTRVTQETMDLNELLGIPGAENITIPEETKPNIFSRKKVDLQFLNEKEKTEETEKSPEDITGKSPEKGETKAKSGKEIIEEVTDPNPGKEKPVKGTIAETLKILIKNGKLIPFEDEKPIEEYTSKDVEELLEANFSEREKKLREQVPAEFFESLPEELQVAAKYVADGGKDLKGLFRALAQAEEVQALDHTDPNNYEKIVRQFLSVTGFGTDEEIDEEIAGMKDRDELEKKAGQFKPKLEKMQEAIIAQKLAEQEQRQAQQAAAAKAYTGSIYKTLEKGELNGIKLDRKIQEFLYAGLIQPRYPSISGRPTNLLGHLLEKYQYVEPNHSLIAEALWLLSNPDDYRNKLREQGKNGQVEKTVRMLRTEEGNKTSGSTVVEKEETTQRRIPRNTNFFKR